MSDAGFVPPGSAGTVEDVREARRALVAEVAPARRTTLPLAGAALAITGSVGLSTAALRRIADGTAADPVAHQYALALVAVGMCVGVAGTIVNLRHRNPPLRPRRLQLYGRRVTRWQMAVAVSAQVVILSLAGLTVTADLWLGWFGIAAVGLNVVMVPAMYALGWRLDPSGVDSPPLREVPDRPAALEPVIAPRLPVMVCAALAGVGQLGTDLLATVLRIDESELAAHSAALINAGYLYAWHDGRRWWLGLTPHGRAAYRRHLRGLLDPTGV